MTHPNSRSITSENRPQAAFSRATGMAVAGLAGRGTRHRSRWTRADDGADVVRAVLAATRGGDMQAARLVLDRIVPVRKGRSIQLDLPTIESAADVLTALSSTIAAMADGEITPDEAAVVAGVLETKRKAIETVELEARLARLEQQAEGR